MIWKRFFFFFAACFSLYDVEQDVVNCALRVCRPPACRHASWGPQGLRGKATRESLREQHQQNAAEPESVKVLNCHHSNEEENQGPGTKNV